MQKPSYTSPAVMMAVISAISQTQQHLDTLKVDTSMVSEPSIRAASMNLAVLPESVLMDLSKKLPRTVEIDREKVKVLLAANEESSSALDASDSTTGASAGAISCYTNCYDNCHSNRSWR